jgi:hypothetical protein
MLPHSHRPTASPAPQIEDEAAFQDRDAIIATLMPHLLNTTVQMPHAIGHPFRLSSCAVEGCLQLIFTASTLEGSPPFAFDDDPSTFLVNLHAQLPASCRQQRVSIHLGGWLACFEGDIAGGGGDGGSAQQQQQQQQPTLRRAPEMPDAGGGSIQWTPVCVESSTPGMVEVVLDFCHTGDESAANSDLEHLLACLGGAGGAQGAVVGVEAVVHCRLQGKEAVGKSLLHAVSGSPGSCRCVMLRAVANQWYSTVVAICIRSRSVHDWNHTGCLIEF